MKIVVKFMCVVLEKFPVLSYIPINGHHTTIIPHLDNFCSRWHKNGWHNLHQILQTGWRTSGSVTDKHPPIPDEGGEPKRPSRSTCVHLQPCPDSNVSTLKFWGLSVLQFVGERTTNKCTNTWIFYKICNPLGTIFITIFWTPFLWLVHYMIWKEKRF